MSVLLYVLGALSVIGGAAAILFGLPVKEFSFGNTLISSGTTALVGGLIVIGLGAAISQLQRIVDMLGARPLSRSGRGLEPFEQPGARLASGRVPFPPKPKVEAPREQGAATTPERAEDTREAEPQFGLPPSLRNPAVPLMAEDEADELPLSPRHTPAASEPRSGMSLPDQERAPDMPPPAPDPARDSEQSSFDKAWRLPPRPSQPSSFENMWPAAEHSPPPAPEEPAPSRAEAIPRAPSMPEPQREPEPREDVQPVAVLKSGVVDGMGYTLYVDGSIEAELPDGTLHFASINELRMHLEKNS